MSITTAMYDFVNFHGQSQVAINLKYFHWNCGLMRQVLAFELSPPFPGIKACPLHYIEFARYWRLLLLIEFVFYKKRRKHLKIKWFIRGFTFDAKNEYFSLSLSFICQKSEWKLFTKLMIISTSLKKCAVAKTFIEKLDLLHVPKDEWDFNHYDLSRQWHLKPPDNSLNNAFNEDYGNWC